MDWPKISLAKLGNCPAAKRSPPDSVKDTYRKANEIGACSPRAAAALLRLALEQIAKDRDRK